MFMGLATKIIESSGNLQKLANLLPYSKSSFQNFLEFSGSLKMQKFLQKPFSCAPNICSSVLAHAHRLLLYTCFLPVSGQGEKRLLHTHQNSDGSSFIWTREKGDTVVRTGEKVSDYAGGWNGTAAFLYGSRHEKGGTWLKSLFWWISILSKSQHGIELKIKEILQILGLETKLNGNF